MGLEDDYDECYVKGTHIGISKKFDSGLVDVEEIGSPFISGGPLTEKEYNQSNQIKKPTQEDVNYHINRSNRYVKMIELMQKEVEKNKNSS